MCTRVCISMYIYTHTRVLDETLQAAGKQIIFQALEQMGQDYGLSSSGC